MTTAEGLVGLASQPLGLAVSRSRTPYQSIPSFLLKRECRTGQQGLVANSTNPSPAAAVGLCAVCA